LILVNNTQQHHGRVCTQNDGELTSVFINVTHASSPNWTAPMKTHWFCRPSHIRWADDVTDSVADADDVTDPVDLLPLLLYWTDPAKKMLAILCDKKYKISSSHKKAS